jgi:DNA repair exonuclease SbcCD ATPase subunit
MPDIHTRTKFGHTVHEPVDVVREQRIDPPHRLGDPPPDQARTKVGVGELSASVGSDLDAEHASLVVVQQLRSQAEQLAAHLQRQQADLDRRESLLQAQAAEIEQQARNNRLWLKERHAELAERETELRHRESELTERTCALDGLENDRASEVKRNREELTVQRALLDRREAAVREVEQSVRQKAAEVESAAAAVEGAAQAHDQLSRELDQRTAQFDDRLAWCIDAVSGFLERGEPPVAGRHGWTARGDTFDALADLLHRLAQRRKNLDETEALLSAASREMNQRRAAGGHVRIESRPRRQGANQTQLDAEQLLAQVRRLLAEFGR